MAIHTGEASLRSGDYYGIAVNHCARLRAAALGGQVLVSSVTVDLVREALTAELTVRDLGIHQLKDIEGPERIWQLVHPDLPNDFLPLLPILAGPQEWLAEDAQRQPFAPVERRLGCPTILPHG
jgi:class 3 adenylate cyclase